MKKLLNIFILFAFLSPNAFSEEMSSDMGSVDSSSSFSATNMLSSVKYGVGAGAYVNQVSVNDKTYNYGFAGEVRFKASSSYVEAALVGGYLQAKEDSEEDAAVSVKAPYAGLSVQVNAGKFYQSMLSPYASVGVRMAYASYTNAEETPLEENYWMALVSAGLGVSVFVSSQASVDLGGSYVFYNWNHWDSETNADYTYGDYAVRGWKAYVGFSFYM